MTVCASRDRRPRSRGFTLIELIIALLLGAIAASAVTLVLSNATRSRDGIRGRVEAFSRAEIAANSIAGDLMNIVRDSDLYFVRVVVINGNPTATVADLAAGATADRDELLMMSVINVPTRNTDEQPESDEAEVQYRIVEGSVATPKPRLFRRADAGPDDVQEGGGVVSPLIDGVVGLSVQASDGETWYDDWDSDLDGLPHMVRIVVTASSADGRYLRTVRRVVAVDRPPLVGTSITADDDETDTGTSNNNSTSGSSGSTGGGSTSGSSNTGTGGGNTSGGGARGGGGGNGGGGGGR